MSRAWRWLGIAGLVVAPAIGASVYFAVQPTPRTSPASADEDSGVPIANRAMSEPQESPDKSEPEVPAEPALRAPALPREAPAPLTPNADSPSGSAPAPGETSDLTDSPISSEQKGARRREGTRLHNVEGIVRKRGTEFEFQPSDSSRSMILLKNQILERIEQYETAKSRDGKRLIWRLSGQVTEYHGENYLLPLGAHIFSTDGADSGGFEPERDAK